jgi:N-acetylneuraminate synthase
MKRIKAPDKNRVFIIAEIGTNHVGSLEIAKRIIDVAVTAGCDAVKLQKKNVEKIYTKEFLDSYIESPWGNTQREMRLHREFSLEQFKELDTYCKKKKINWFVSCWDTESQILMRRFKTKYNKIASAMLTHKKLVNLIAEEQKYTFISTGMSTLRNIENVVKIFRKNNCPFELMHSHSSYPMPYEEANLKLIPVLREKFKCNVGYSGHEVGATDVCIPAVMMGATSIERHVTIDRTFYGHDQAASLEPSGLIRLVRDIRIIDKLLGDGKKKIWPSEIPAQKKLRQIFV